MQGRRVPDETRVHDMKPGDYGRMQINTGGGPFWAWWFCTPNGIFGRLSMSEDSPNHHHVEEHADGTITVLPQENNSNSILTKGANDSEWHGYIRHGVWEAVG